MKRAFKLKTFIFLIATTSLFFTGCGSNGIDNVYERADDSAITDYVVQVVDDPVYGATILANECTGFEERTNGYYLLTGCSTRPKAIIASGGYMVLDDKNVSMGFPLMINTNMIKQSTMYTATPLTTLLATVDSYNELVAIKDALSFNKVQDMFVDDNATRDMQRTLNSFFIEAQENGVDLNNFADFTADLRSMIKKTGKLNGGGLATIKEAKSKMKDDFDNNPDKYLNKYGVVFSGFVTSTNYNDQNDSKDLLKNIGQKFAGDAKTTVFSGFIYDDIIGKGNDKYAQNANIAIINLETNVTIAEVNASDFGQYTLKLNSSDINETISYLLVGTLVNKAGKDIKLNSILTGKEILSKFKAKLNSKDIPGLNITNVTTAKVIILEKSGIDLKNVDDVIEKKEDIAESNTTKELLLDISVGLKAIIDGDANTTGNKDTFTYVKELVTTPTTFTPAADMNDSFEEFKEEVKNDKTLNDQIEQKKVIEKFKVVQSDILNKELIFKLSSESTPRKLYIFEDGSFNFIQYQEDFTSVNYVGDWNITSDGDINLVSTQSDNFKLSFTSLEQSKALYDSIGKFIGMSESPKGRLISQNSSLLFEVVKINSIDTEEIKAPLVKFSKDDLVDKQFFVVYQDESDDNKSKELYYKFNSNDTVESNDDYDDGLDKRGSSTVSYSVSTDGILTVNGTDYKVINSYKSKIIVLENNTKKVEFFYAQVNAAAAKETNNYSKPERFVDLFDSSNWDFDSDDNNNPDYNKINTTSNRVLKAVPLNNDKNNYKESYVGTYLKKSAVESAATITKVVGIQAKSIVTENNGDSARQTAGIMANYYIPKCANPSVKDQLRVHIITKYNSIRYQISKKDSSGNTVNLYDKSVEIVKENTLKANYEFSTLIAKNHVVMQVKNGENAYFAYVPLKTLWKANESELKEYKYPTSYRNSYLFAKLKDENNGEVFKGKSNAPISVRLNDFKLINGPDTDSYEGGATPYCQ